MRRILPSLLLFWAFIACSSSTVTPLIHHHDDDPPPPGGGTGGDVAMDSGSDADADAGTSDADASIGDDADSSDADAAMNDDADAGANDASDAVTPAIPLQIIVEPSDDAQALIDAIDAAASSVHMVMYLLTSKSVEAALVAAKNRGLEVAVLLNQTFPSDSSDNASSFVTLQSAGISVAWAPAVFTLTHEKCVIIDKTVAWIMTMNTTQTSPSNNREYLAVDAEAGDVAEAEALFQSDFAGAPTPAAGTLVVSPDNSRDRLSALIESATQTVDLEGEVLSDPTIVAALSLRAKAGVEVRVVLSDSTPTMDQQTAVASLMNSGVRVVTLSSPYLHAKAIVADGARAYVGSENFTTQSLTYNRELGLLFDTKSEVMKVGATIAADFANGTPPQ